MMGVGFRMDHLKTYDKPTTGASCMITAFRGWPDAGDGASSAIKYLLRKLQAKQFAELDPEEFYDFSQVRPRTSTNSQGIRTLKWPANELFHWASDDPSNSLMFFLGTEPNLKWRTYSNAILNTAEASGVTKVLHIGSLLDAVPHTREVRITGSSNVGDIKETLAGYKITSSNYQGPTGIASAMMEACTAKGLSYTTLWAHTPHYLQAAPNFRISHALVSNLARFLELPVELDELRSAATVFDLEVEKAVTKDSQIDAYVQKLEERYDSAAMLDGGDMPQPDEMVKELEEFLKGRQRGHGGDAT